MEFHIREAVSLEEFAAVATDAAHVTDTARYVQRLFDTQCSRLDWCLIAENTNGVPSARIALWRLPEREKPLDFVLLNGDWGGDRAALRVLMQHVENIFRKLGCADIGHCQDMPPREPQWQTYEAERKAFLESVGFRVVRHTLRYRREALLSLASRTNDASSSGEARLKLVPVNTANEALLVDLVARVAAVSHDELDRSGCAKHGATEHARCLIADLREMRVDNDWWHIAYTPAHTTTHAKLPESARTEAVGFILPTASADMGTIGYVGILPAHRGRGYTDALIAHATRVLTDAKFKRIIADTDRSNRPMARAFERNGWECFGERLEWKKTLD